MTPRDAYWSLLLNLAAAVLYGLFVQPWLGPLKRAGRTAFGGLWRRLRTGGQVRPLSGPQPELPPGTVSATAMAMQPPPSRPQFVNNSIWMQWEAAQRQRDIAARLATDSQWRSYRAALLSPVPTQFTMQ